MSEPQLRVRWELDVFDKDTPLDAAKMALATQRNPESIATVFEVFDLQGRQIATVDLEEPPGYQVTLATPAAPVAAGSVEINQSWRMLNPSVRLEELDTAFAAEIGKVSTLEYNSNAICREFYGKLRERLVGPPVLAASAAAEATPPRLYVQWGNPFGDGPVVAVLRVEGTDLDLARQRSTSVRTAGMIEATYSAGDLDAYFVEGYEDGDSSYAEVFAATTAMPAELFERLEADYEQHFEAQGRWIEGADVATVLQRLESIKSMGYTERSTWGAAEVFAGEALVVKAAGEAFALYEHTDDNGKVSNFTVNLPLAADVPTVELDAMVSPRP